MGCEPYDMIQTAKIGSLVDVQGSDDPEGMRVFYYLVQDLKVRRELRARRLELTGVVVVVWYPDRSSCSRSFRFISRSSLYVVCPLLAESGWRRRRDERERLLTFSVLVLHATPLPRSQTH